MITVPNFIKISQIVAEIGWCNGFQNGSCSPSWIFEIQFLTLGAVKRPILHQRNKFRKDRSNRKSLRRYRDFCDFQDSGCRHLGFSKIPKFNGRSSVRGQWASPCQISSKSVKRLQRYSDLTVFKMGAVRHLGFVPFCTSVPNFVKIGQTAMEISRFLWLSRWRLPPSWIFKNSKF